LETWQPWEFAGELLIQKPVVWIFLCNPVFNDCK
jgi:hypothetical protein